MVRQCEDQRDQLDEWEEKIWQHAGPHFGTTSVQGFYDLAIEKAGIDRTGYFGTRRGLYDETMNHQDHALVDIGEGEPHRQHPGSGGCRGQLRSAGASGGEQHHVRLVRSHQESLELPPGHHHRAIVETEPAVKGQTAANSFKPAVLDNGVRIMVPPFVGQDEQVVVNTETMEYSERA